MRQLQKKAGVGDYDHVVIHPSIIRPAANKYITQFIKRCYRHEPWEPLHPRLAGIFSETFGVLGYQEDVSKAAIAVADFDESSADALRKIFAKKNKAAKLAEFREKFFSGCARNGVGEPIAADAWNMMESFSGYSFCKPHSASYAVVSFRSAWLRCHHPTEFMAAVLSNGGGVYTANAYVSEARRMGIPIRGPDVNESEWTYPAVPAREIGKNEDYMDSGRYRDRGQTSAKRNDLVIGLMAISGLGQGVANNIVEERRRNGRFQNLESFAMRMYATRRPSTLAKSGPTSIPVRKDGAGQNSEGQTRVDCPPGFCLGAGQILSLVEAGAFDSLACGISRPTQSRILLHTIRQGGEKGLPGLCWRQGQIEMGGKGKFGSSATRSPGQDTDRAAKKTKGKNDKQRFGTTGSRETTPATRHREPYGISDGGSTENP